MKKLLFTFAVSIALMNTPHSSMAASVSDGQACSPAGATFKQGTTTFKCTKVGAAEVWKKVAKKSSSPAPVEVFTMPRVVGMNLQEAQDLLQSKGSYLMDQTDYKGLSRFQILDSQWKVCAQSPSPGKKVPISTIVTLSSVKLTERC